MGKKPKSKRSGRPGASPVSHKIQDRAVCKLVDELWERTQSLESASLHYLLGELKTVRHFTKQIRDKQGPSPAPLPERGEALGAMVKWLEEQGVVNDMVEIAVFPHIGYGLKAKREIKQEEKVMSVHCNVMMTINTAKDGQLGTLVSKDRMLQLMPNLTLALHLLNERYNRSSRWKPYIDSLPHEYTTPFYYSEDDLNELQTSPCLVKAIVQIRNVSKLYTHLHRLIRKECDPSLPLYEAGFHLADFLWAVSTVMSRQNEIPAKVDGSGNVLSLIPLWDLCNHTEGHMTTFYNLEQQTCDCYALEDTPAGEEFRIFYGSRPNHDLLIHQGFVYMENKSDTLQIKLGLSADDPHRDSRKQLLQSLGIPIGGEFSVYSLDCPFSQSLVGYTRIFTANEEELKGLLSLGDEGQLAETLYSDCWSGDDRVMNFLRTRCQILLRSYRTSLEEDTKLLDSSQSSTPYARLAIQMRVCEKRILTNAIAYAQTISEELDTIRTMHKSGEVSQEALRKGRVLAAPVSRAGHASPRRENQQTENGSTKPPLLDTGEEERVVEEETGNEDTLRVNSEQVDDELTKPPLLGTGEEERVSPTPLEESDNEDTLRVDESSESEL